MKLSRRILSLIMVLCMITASVPFSAVFAADSDFVIDEAGTLTAYNGGGGDLVIPEGVTAIGDYVFADNTSITSVELPSGLTSLGEGAFSGCSNLSYVSMPESIVGMGDYVFENCTALAEIELPGGIESIPASAFSGCETLTSVVIPEGVYSVGTRAFYNCISLAYVYVPVSVSEIGTRAFTGCDSLVLYGIAGSYAEEYALENSISFVAEGGSVDENGYTVINPGDTLTATIASGGENVKFAFTPEVSGEYFFYSDSDYDTYCDLYDSNGNYLAYNDDYTDRDFGLVYDFTAGSTYYFNVRMYSSSVVGSFDVYLREVVTAESVSITAPETTVLYPMSSMTLSAALAPEEAKVEEIYWRVDDESVAMVDYNSGELTALKAGSVTVTAFTEGGLEDSLEITVLPFEEIVPDTPVTASTSEENVMAYYSFTPAEDGYYTFYSVSPYDTYGYLYNVSGVCICSNDDYGSDANFSFTVQLTAGETYYFAAKLLSYGYADFEICVTKTVLPDSVSIYAEDSVELELGASLFLEPVLSPEDAHAGEIVWESSDHSIVDVYGGEITAWGVGTAVITATAANGVSDTLTVTVPEPAVLKPGSEATGTLTPEDTVDAYALAAEEDTAYYFTLVFPEYAEVRVIDSNCNEIGYGSGYDITLYLDLSASETYYAIISSYNVYSDTEFTVSFTEVPAATEVKIVSDYTLSGFAGDNIWLNVEFLPEGACSKYVTFSSDNPDVIYVEDSGYLAFFGEGEANITVTTENGLTDTVTVSCLPTPELTLGESYSVSETDPFFMRMSFTCPEDGLYAFTSSGVVGMALYGELLDADRSYLTDDYSGEGEGFYISYYLTAGETYYLRSYPSYYDTLGDYTVTVMQVVEAEGIEILLGDTYTGTLFGSVELEAQLVPENASRQEIYWESSDYNVVDILNGSTAYFRSIGTATVTVYTDSGLSDTVEITVASPEVIQLDTAHSVNILTGGTQAAVSFTPEESGIYSFYSTADMDTTGTLYDSDMNQLQYDDDGGEDNNFRIEYNLEAGVTYILVTRYYSSSNTGSYNICVERATYVTSMEIVSMPYRVEYVEGFVTSSIDLYGLELSLNWSNGTVSTWTYGDYSEVYVEFNYDNADTTGEIIMTCDLAQCVLQLTVVENPVLSMELIGDTIHNTYVQNVNGNWNSRYNDETGEYEDFFCYNTEFPYDAVVRITMKDGSVYEAAPGDEVCGNRIGWSHDQYNEPWVLGSGNVSVISYLGFTVELPITIIEDPIASVELVCGTSLTYTENVDGYWDSRYNEDTGEYEEFFYYYGETPTDATVRITFTDGTTMDAKVGDYLYGSYVGWGCNQYDDPWVVGSDNESYIVVLGRSVLLPITVSPDPIVSIELECGTAHQYIENTGGYWDERYNHDTGEYEEFYYYYTEYPSDAQIRINLTDGTYVILNAGDEYDGYYVEWQVGQYDEPWVLGSDNITYLYYKGHSVELPITVVESPVQSIEVVSAPQITYIENGNGYWDSRYNEETGEHEDYFHYYTNTPWDAVVQINYKDGTTATANVGDYLNGDEVTWYDDQHITPWTLGENITYVSYMGCTAELPVTVIENPVESVTLVSGTDIKFIENADGYWDTFWSDDVTEAFFYYSGKTPYDAVVEVTYKDGTSVTASIGDVIEPYGISVQWEHDQYTNHWVVGTDNESFIVVAGFEVLLPITVMEDPVESIELISGEYSLIENADGDWDERWNSETETYEDFYYYYIYWDEINAVIKINFKDGTSVEASFGDVVDGFEVSLSHNQYDKPWVLGSDNELYITYGGHSVALPVTVNENPVESVVLETGTTITFVENYGGYLRSDWNPETQSEEEYYFYDQKYPTGATIRINFKDGTSVVANPYDFVRGYSISLGFMGDNSQYNKHWTVGSDNMMQMEYLGHIVDIPVTVIENPVESIELVSGTPVTVIENYDGYWIYDENGKFFVYYNHFPDDAVIKVNYKDGTSATGSAGSKIGGYYASVSSDQYDKHWTLGEDNVMYLTYLGHTVEYPVTVIENPVESIEFVSAEFDPFIENAGGYWFDWYNEETGENEQRFYYYIGRLHNTQIRINYKDGTSTTTYASEYVNGYHIDINVDQRNNPWVVGDDNEATASYLGFTASIPVTVVENPVERIELNSAPTREYIFGDTDYGITYDSEYEITDIDLAGLQFTVYYKDGTSKTFTYSNDETFGGHDLDYSFNGVFTEPGDMVVTLIYLGHEFEYTAKIVESTVESIEILKGPDSYPLLMDLLMDPTGMELKVNYKDGTSTTVTVDDTNLSYAYNYYMNDITPTIDIDGYEATVVAGRKGETLTAEYTVSFLGCSASGAFDYAYGYGAVTEITDVVLTADGVVEEITVKLSDGASLTFKPETVFSRGGGYEDEDVSVVYSNIFGMTEYGVIEYTLYETRSGDSVYYSLLAFGIEVEVGVEAEPDYLPGDVNSDGRVAMTDASLLSRALSGAKLEYSSDASDVNTDGRVAATDLNYILRRLGGASIVLG